MEQGADRKRRRVLGVSMDGLLIIGFVVAYFLLTWVVLPRLGVPT
jgi:hypothetical protein